MKNNPFWYKLIKRLKKDNEITTGITIPYLFGAYKIIGNPFSHISDLIDEITLLPIDEYPVIQNCYQIKHHVIMTEPKQFYNKKYSKGVKIKNHHTNNLLIISDNTNLGKDLKSIITSLRLKYQIQIEKETYSWNKKLKIWQIFSEDEILRIQEVGK